MERHLLTQKEIKFIRGCQRWNRKFETIFAALFIFTIILPVIIMMKMDLPGLRETFDEARFYSFAVSLGWLVTFLNERWLRIVDKLIRLDGFDAPLEKRHLYAQKHEPVAVP
jgi:hypothetical protein